MGLIHMRVQLYTCGVVLRHLVLPRGMGLGLESGCHVEERVEEARVVGYIGEIDTIKGRRCHLIEVIEYLRP